MARHRDGRSPSPAGTSRADRSYRDDRRHRDDGRDDRGGNRRRTRSRSVERRRHDRDYRKDRDRSPGRTDERRRDDHRRRDRSPARNRDRDLRDRSRDRDRDHRSRRDDSRSRRRGDDTADRHSARRDRSRDTVKNGEHARSWDKTREPTPKSQSGEATAASAADEKKQEERRAKVADMKKKLEAKQKEKLKQQQSANGVAAILAEMDKPPTGHTAPSDDVKPTQDAPEPVEAATSDIPALAKFDPKALVKKASTTTSGPIALGGDIAIPQAQKPQSSLTQTNVLPGQSNGNLAKTKLARGAKLSAFEISSKQEKGEGKKAIDLDDDESSRQKLQKLPTNDSALLTEATENGEDAVDAEDEEGSMDADNEEEDAAAARLAVERREELRLQQLNASADEMTGVVAAEESEPMTIDVEQADEEDEDPLDAFMKDMNAKTTRAKPNKKTASTLPAKKRKFEAEAFFGDETDDREAVGDANDDVIAIAAKRAKKKEIPTVIHSKMNYEPFKKNFYVPPSELANLTPEAIADMRLELDGIKVKGTDVPAPVENWAQCGLGLQTLDVIAKLGYTKPTSIQAQAIPAIMSGRDIIGVAKTGSGKTAAFLMPMFRHIKDQRPIANMEGPIGLIIAPTRELAQQIHRDCKPFLKALGLRAACTYGGAPIKDQIADLKRGAEIIVCTTGRIIELLSANQGRVTNLSRVTYVVLDEADRMFDMGFEPQIMKILGNIRPDRQTVLFSATFPRQMEALARKVLRKPIEIQVGGRSTVAPEITQVVEVLEEDGKFKRLLQMLGELYINDDDVRSLIFVERQESADSLLSELLRKGYPCMSIHGGKDQIDRDSTIDDFKKGIFPVMIATSVAARGLDVKQLKLVVNYDCPNHLEDYVHRVGRTGRAGNTGTALTFITPEQEKYAVDISKALRQSGQEVPQDVQKLADSFMEKVKAGKAEATGRGFGGKGIDQYDEKRAATRRAERNQYKTGDEPEEVDEEAEKKLDDEIAVKTGAAPIVAREAPRAATPEDDEGPRFDLSTIIIHKTERPAPSGEQSGNPLDKVRLASQRIGNRLSQRGHIYPGQPIDNRGPDAGAYHTTLSINDFPQKARWAVTNRTNVAKILDSTQTSITTKGNFYADGKEPGEGDPPKLYILIEGDSEHQVKGAVAELDRLLRDATAAAITTAAARPVAGRYSVL